MALANTKKGKHIVTSNIEHNAVLRTLRRLRMMDFKVSSSVGVDETGRVNPEEIAKAITEETILVTVMHSNNEIGTLQPIEEIGRITREKKIPFHCDARDFRRGGTDGCTKIGGGSAKLFGQPVLRSFGRGRPLYPFRDQPLAFTGWGGPGKQ